MFFSEIRKWRVSYGFFYAVNFNRRSFHKSCCIESSHCVQNSLKAMTEKRALIYGGRGALGSTCVETFRNNGWWVLSIDVFEQPKANSNIVLNIQDDMEKHVEKIENELDKDMTFKCILCVAGGWAGGAISSRKVFSATDLMWRQSVWSSVIASHIASKHLDSDGFLQLTGAVPCLQGTPGMVGYGMAKAAVHQLIKSLACPSSGLSKTSTVFGILPIVLDTPGNRAGMPSADTSSWTPLDYVAGLLLKIVNKDAPCDNGSLIKLVTENGTTKTEVVS